jgi:hypothetical protein
MKEKFEMEKLKMGIVQAESNTKSGSQSEHFDAAKNIRLVPKFSEKAVDKYTFHLTCIQGCRKTT